jgi:hypothetical protein
MGYAELSIIWPLRQRPSGEDQGDEPCDFSSPDFEDKLRRTPCKGCAEMNRKVYEVDPLACSKCGSKVKVIAFIADFSVLGRIIDNLKLSFVADKPPPPRLAYQEVLMAAETTAEYFSCSSLYPGGEVWPISSAFMLPFVFWVYLSLFFAQLDIRSRRDLSFLTIGRGKMGTGTLI